MQPACGRRGALLLLAVALCAWTAPDAVASWRGNAGVASGLVFTDNLFLSPTDQESDVIWRLRPSVSYGRTGNRLRVNFNYAPTGLMYFGNSDLNSVQHTLGASANAELIERYFFVDVRANANQVLIDPTSTGGVRRRQGGFDSIANPDAFTQVASISVTPRLELPVAAGRFATIEFEPGVGAVFQASTAESNTRNTTGVSDTRVTVTSGPVFSTMPWSLSWRNRLFDDNNNDRLGSFRYNQSYIFNRRYRLTGILGYDDSNFQSRRGRDSGGRWELRFDWTPKPTSSFQLGFGQAFFGNFWSAQGRHRHKRWAFTGSYRVSIENALTTILDQEVVPLVDVFGEPIIDPINGDVLTANIDSPVLIDDTFLNHRWTSTVGYQRGRNSANLNWSITQRDYSRALLDTTDFQVRLSFSRRLSARLTGTAAVRYWDHSEGRVDGRDFQQDGIDLTASYRLGPRTTLNSRIARQNRDSSLPNDSFDEHRFSIDLSFQL